METKTLQKITTEIERGANATREVSDWTRYLAVSEAESGGSFYAANEAITAPQWPSVTRELFAGLVGSAEDGMVAAGDRRGTWVEKAVEVVEQSPEWRTLAEITRDDAWAAGLAVSKLAKAASGALKDVLPKTDLRAADEAVKALQGVVDDIREDPEAEVPAEISEALKAALDTLSAAGMDDAKAASVLATLASASAKPTAGQILRATASIAAAQAKAEIQDLREAMSGFGIGTGASGSTLRVKANEDAARKRFLGSAKLREIAKIAGRLKADARRKQATKTPEGREEIASIKTGSDIERVVPSELTYLADPLLATLLFKRLADASALEYELTGTEKAIGGPIIVAIDESGSMNGIRDQWAKGAALALLDVASKQGREFAIIHFDDRVHRTDVFENTKTITFDRLVEAVEYFANGNTSFLPPLTKALDLVKAAKLRNAKLAKADVVLITDGFEFSMSSDAGKALLAAYKAEGVAIHGITINAAIAEPLKASLSTETNLTPDDLAKTGKLDQVFSI